MTVFWAKNCPNQITTDEIRKPWWQQFMWCKGFCCCPWLYKTVDLAPTELIWHYNNNSNAARICPAKNEYITVWRIDLALFESCPDHSKLCNIVLIMVFNSTQFLRSHEDQMKQDPDWIRWYSWSLYVMNSSMVHQSKSKLWYNTIIPSAFYILIVDCNFASAR